MTSDEAMGLFHPSTANDVDGIDAALFTGDEFLDAHKRAALRVFLGRWEAQLKMCEEMENLMDDPK